MWRLVVEAAKPVSMAVAGCVIVKQSRELHVEMFPATWRRLALAGVTSITGRADRRTWAVMGTAYLHLAHTIYLPMHKYYVFKLNCASEVERGCLHLTKLPSPTPR